MRLSAWVLALMLLLPAAHAINIGASPGTVQMDSLAKGGYGEQEILITTNSEVNVTGHIDFGGEIGPWVRLYENQSTFIFSRTRPFATRVVIEPPADAQAGNYSGTISFVTDALSTVEGTTGSAVRASVAIRVLAEVVGEQFVSCSASGFSAPDVERGRFIELSASVFNTGNVRVSPQVAVSVWDQLRSAIVLQQSFRVETVLPTTRKSVAARIEQDLPPGQYWLEVSVPECAETAQLTFSVVEPGSIADYGVLEGIYAKPYAYAGEPAEITAIFDNKGPRSVEAQFKGSIQRDGRTLSTLNSDVQAISAGTKSEFKMFYTPPGPGSYTITGRVTYNNKLSFEKSVAFSALAGESGGSFPYILIYVFILIVLIVLIFLIRRELSKTRHE